MKVLVVTEYYPRAHDPALGIWVHRQVMASREAGADVRVLALHRPIPPLRALREGDLAAALGPVTQSGRQILEGVPVRYLRYLSPPRPLGYGSWGAWAALPLSLAMRRIRARFAYDLVHAHYAAPAGDAVRRAAPSTPLIVSVHGHDVQGARAGGRSVRSTLAHARIVLANSGGTARRCRALGASRTRVVHLGTDVPAEAGSPPEGPGLVTVAHLAARKRHEDVLRALSRLRDRQPGLRYTIVGAGPERPRLETLARSLGVADRVEFRGALPPREAQTAARAATLFVMPSIDEAFGVAYIEAMAGGVPALGCQGEDGPEEIAASGAGMELVRPRDPLALSERIDGLLRDRPRLEELGRRARDTVVREFTWERCGRETVAAYHEAMKR